MRNSFLGDESGHHAIRVFINQLKSKRCDVDLMDDLIKNISNKCFEILQKYRGSICKMTCDLLYIISWKSVFDT